MNTNNKFLQIIILTSLVLLLTGCDDPQDDFLITNEDSSFVTFDDYSLNNVSTAENAGMLSLPFHVTPTTSTSDLTIGFETVDSTALLNQHYRLVSNSVTIPAGEYGGNLEIEILDDQVFNQSRFFTVRIGSISGGAYQLGSGVDGSLVKNIVIANDDCPSQSNLWWGDLVVQDVGFPNVTGVTGSANANGDCDVLLVSGDLGGFNVPEAQFEFFLTPNSAGATSGTVDVPSQLYCSECSAGLDVFYSASGTYDETTQTIIVFYRVERTDGAGYNGTNIINPE